MVRSKPKNKGQKMGDSFSNAKAFNAPSIQENHRGPEYFKVRLWREKAKANKQGSLQAQLFVLCIFNSTQGTPAPCADTLG